MAAFTIHDQVIHLPAMLVQPTAESDEKAWQGGIYLTIRLEKTITVLRVHTKGKSFPGRKGSDEEGRWLLIGDVIQTASEIADSRSLPTTNPRSMAAFTHTSEAVVAVGTVLNIGIASALFGGNGGGWQAQFVSGPPMVFRPFTNKHWIDFAGNA